jgi:serine protease AprX
MMKPTRRFTTFLLLLSLCVSALVVGGASANTGNTTGDDNQWQVPDKVSPELRERVRGGQADETVSVILQLKGPPTGLLNALFQRNGVRVKGHFADFDCYSVDLPVSVVDELANYDEVKFLSTDAPLEVFGHITSTTGAEAVRTIAGSTTELDGTGIGIAILDSGLYLEHKAFKNAKGTSRIVYSQDFTGEK